MHSVRPSPAVGPATVFTSRGRDLVDALLKGLLYCIASKGEGGCHLQAFEPLQGLPHCL